MSVGTIQALSGAHTTAYAAGYSLAQGEDVNEMKADISKFIGCSFRI